ncbi:MAG: ComEC/Rec2 family competence protein, partial [Chthoniobacteraceae bacterium]|nr:ComEC/Rec2 family competence protein [Chthoniobacteraceae bacterium]
MPLALCAMAGIVTADGLAPIGGGPLAPCAAGGALLLGLAAILWQRRKASRHALFCAWAAVAALFFAWHAWALTSGPGPALAAGIPAQGCVVEAVGVVDGEPDPPARFAVRLQSLTRGEKSAPCAARVLVRWPGDAPRYGDRVTLAGDLHLLEPPRNPGVFDSPRVWHRRGVYAELRVRYPRDARVMEHDRGSPFIARSLALRHWMERTMALDIEDSPQLVALIQSMVLGTSGDSLKETQKLFQYTGTMHLFAVSGMNVAMLAGVLQYVLQVAGLRRRAMVCLILPALWVYCYATGLAASSLRATLMATVVYLGLLLDRPALSWNTLGAAVLGILAWDSNQLFTPGFQLSFGMVAFLLAFAPRSQQALRPLTDPDPFVPRLLWPTWLLWSCKARRFAVDAASVSTIAWIGSMPLTLYYFHLWSPSTIPANLFAVIPAWLMMTLGMASVLAGMVWAPLAALFNNANWLIAKGLLAGISWMAALPGAHEYIEFQPRTAP